MNKLIGEPQVSGRAREATVGPAAQCGQEAGNELFTGGPISAAHADEKPFCRPGWIC